MKLVGLPKTIEPGSNTVFVDRGIHEAGLAGGLVDVGEEIGLLVAVVRIYAVVPGDAILDKIRLVYWWYAWSLLIYTIEASDERVMAYSHFGCFEGERVFL